MRILLIKIQCNLVFENVSFELVIFVEAGLVAFGALKVLNQIDLIEHQFINYYSVTNLFLNHKMVMVIN